MKMILTGNEAIDKRAWEAGLHVAAAYPGTPSTEILENLAMYKEVYSEWSTNEKVALEVAAGASIAGARALAAMKHVGLNVAADPLFTLAYTGVNGGLVIVTADDPGLFSSQNEQDNRFYADFARVLCFEPASHQEAYDQTREAFDLSEKFGLPVMIRLVTRLAHSRAPVVVREPRGKIRALNMAMDQTGLFSRPMPGAVIRTCCSGRKIYRLMLKNVVLMNFLRPIKASGSELLLRVWLPVIFVKWPKDWKQSPPFLKFLPTLFLKKAP